jgi:hypothetical protein
MVYTRTQYIHQIFWGSTVNTCLAILTNSILVILESDMIEILACRWSKIIETKNLKRNRAWLCKDVNIFWLTRDPGEIQPLQAQH